jgi:hypothetical protein
MIHVDKAPQHKAEKFRNLREANGFPLATHPHQTFDLAPSKFFLLAYAKAQLQGMEFRSEPE